MLPGMRNPPEPPAPPGEPYVQPYLPTQTPRMGTLLGMPNPLPLPPRGAQARATEAPEAELARHLAGLRLELAAFREWLPEVLGARGRPGPAGLGPGLAALAGLAPGSAALAAPAPPPLPGPGERRGVLAPLLVALAGAVLALALVFASASAALSWPAYARLVAGLGGDLHSR